MADKELSDLKSALRSLVVSSSAQMDVRSLARDYRALMGSSIPIAQYGYRDLLTFLKERCGDCFLFQGAPTNPVLTLIVPESLKHIDQFVQRSKSTKLTKMKGKRRSVETSSRAPSKPTAQRSTSLIYDTFKSNKTNYSTNTNREENILNSKSEDKSNHHNSQLYMNSHPSEVKPNHRPSENKCNEHAGVISTKLDQTFRNNNMTSCNGRDMIVADRDRPANIVTVEKYDNLQKEEKKQTSNILNFSKKCSPMASDSRWHVDSVSTDVEQVDRSMEDEDSGRQTSSSRSSTRRAQLEELQDEVLQLLAEHEGGVLCTDILKLYRMRFGRELPLSRLGYNNITSLLTAMQELVRFAQEGGGVRVWDARRPVPRAPHPRPRPLSRAHAHPPAARVQPVDPDDALPGIEYDADVFPADCMHFTESIPGPELAGVCTGAMFEVAVGEVYSPSHFWLQRLGPRHSEAMHAIMDEMTDYYSRGAGCERWLARGAVRVGQYCAAVYDGDWHRALIVKILDSESVKVRHIDYGTVDVVRVSSLKPLLRRWAALEAQAVRARLAGLRPGAGGRRWPHAAAVYFLALVREKRFVANVVAVDQEEETLETFLIDTSGADDVCVSGELVRAKHADARCDSALRSGECYLLPRFEPLESGATPNFAEIHRYLADGINLEFVDAYRRHVPAALPARTDSPAPPSPPAPLQVLNRVPLLRVDSPPAAAAPTHLSPWADVSTELAVSEPPPLALSLETLSLAAGGDAPRQPAAADEAFSNAECEMYKNLNELDPTAALLYMFNDLRRATAAAQLNKHALGMPLQHTMLAQHAMPPQQAMPPQHATPLQHAMPLQHVLPLRHTMPPHYVMRAQNAQPPQQLTQYPEYGMPPPGFPPHASPSSLNPHAPEFCAPFYSQQCFTPRMTPPPSTQAGGLRPIVNTQRSRR